MPEVIARFRKQHPDAQVVLVDALVSGLLETLETGQADLAISNDASSRPGIESAPLFRSRLHLVCPARHALARRRHASWDEWRREPLICIGTLPLLQLRSELGPKLELEDIRVVGDVTAALTMVAAGVGLAICPGYVLPATRVHRLRAIPCTDPVVVREYALHRRGVATLSPVAVSFKAFLETHFADGKGRCVEAARPSLLA